MAYQAFTGALAAFTPPVLASSSLGIGGSGVINEAVFAERAVGVGYKGAGALVGVRGEDR